MYLSIFNSFRVIRCLSRCVSPKIAILPHFCFPWDAPGVITLNVVWMEREFDAYKLPRCMCPSNYNRFWDRARYLWKKSSFYHTALHSTPPLGGGVPVGILPSRLVWKNYSGGATWWWKNFEDMCNRLGTIPACDRKTDRQTSCNGIVRAMHTRRAVKR